MTLQDAFNAFILSRQLADLSSKTIKSYTEFIIPFLRHMDPFRHIDSITQDDIRDYISSVLKRPISKSTRSTYIRNLKIFLRWCQKQYDVIYDAKEIKVPKASKRNVRIYSNDEIMLIFDSIQAESDWIIYRNKCIIALMYDSGLRQSEVCSLRWNRITFTDKIMIVRGKGDKERTVPIGNLTQKYMRLYSDLCPYHLDCVFVDRTGSPLSNNAVKLMVSKLADSLPFDLSSHKLRHNFATNYCLDQYEQNGSIDIYKLMYLMGHEDIETTERYLHLAYEVIASKGNISHLDGIFLE